MTLSLSENECWQAVQNREASLTAPFFYAVRSTKIYCRPWCPSRRPRRDLVTFFAATDDAEAAGTGISRETNADAGDFAAAAE